MFPVNQRCAEFSFRFNQLCLLYTLNYSLLRRDRELMVVEEVFPGVFKWSVFRMTKRARVEDARVEFG